MTKKPSKRGLRPDELRAQEGLELPDREAMSLLTGLPSLGGGLVGGADPTASPTNPSATPTDGTGVSTPLDSGSTGAAPGDGAGAGAAPAPGPGGDMATFAPVNKASVLNQLSNGSTQGAGSTQTTPITQST